MKVYKDIQTHDIFFFKNVMILRFCERGQIKWNFKNVKKLVGLFICFVANVA